MIKFWVISFLSFIIAGSAMAASVDLDRQNALKTSGQIVAPHESRPSQKAVLILIDRLSFQDIQSGKLPSLKRLSSKAAIGVMNANVWGRKGPESAYVTLGAGSRSVGNFMASQGYDSKENLEEGPAGVIFQRLTGHPALPESAVGFGVASLIRDNRDDKSMAIPGNLGEALRRKGLRTAVIGNSDDPEHPTRLGVAVAMDSAGLVDYGAVGKEMALLDPQAPLGMRTNPEAILQAFKPIYLHADLIVVDLGDTARIERARTEILESIFESRRDEALARTDALFNALLKQIDLNKTLLIVASPCPPVPDGMWNSLPPVMMAGKGIQPGLLVSATTHTPGLIANIDLAPTILNFLNTPTTPVMTGHSARGTRSSHPIQAVSDYSQWATLNYQIRIDIMVFCGILVVLAVSLMIISLIFAKKLKPWVPALSRVLLLAAMTIPLASLIPPLVTISNPVLYFVAWIGSLVGITALSYLLGRKKILGPPIALLAMTAVVVLIDSLTQNSLSSRSPIAACPITGIRYYGLGNEYMGALLGSMLVTLAYFFRGNSVRGFRSVLLLLALGITILTIGGPWIGANAGGAMAAIPGLGLLGLLLCGYKIGRRHVIQLLLGSVIILALLTLIDTLRNPAQQSHIGQVAGQISQGGYGYAGQIILRKIQMNLGLITGKAGSTVILCLIPAFALWVYVLRDRSLRVMNLHPWLREAAKAAALTVPLALLFNDSGIVPAAIITASVVMPWLWLMLGEGENS